MSHRAHKSWQRHRMGQAHPRSRPSWHRWKIGGPCWIDTRLQTSEFSITRLCSRHIL